MVIGKKRSCHGMFRYYSSLRMTNIIVVYTTLPKLSADYKVVPKGDGVAQYQASPEMKGGKGPHSDDVRCAL